MAINNKNQGILIHKIAKSCNNKQNFKLILSYTLFKRLQKKMLIHQLKTGLKVLLEYLPPQCLRVQEFKLLVLERHSVLQE